METLSGNLYHSRIQKAITSFLIINLIASFCCINCTVTVYFWQENFKKAKDTSCESTGYRDRWNLEGEAWMKELLLCLTQFNALHLKELEIFCHYQFFSVWRCSLSWTHHHKFDYGGWGPSKRTSTYQPGLSVCVINDERRIMSNIYLEDATWEVLVSSCASPVVQVKKEVVVLRCLWALANEIMSLEIFFIQYHKRNNLLGALESNTGKWVTGRQKDYFPCRTRSAAS